MFVKQTCQKRKIWLAITQLTRRTLASRAYIDVTNFGMRVIAFFGVFVGLCFLCRFKRRGRRQGPTCFCITREAISLVLRLATSGAGMHNCQVAESNFWNNVVTSSFDPCAWNPNTYFPSCKALWAFIVYIVSIDWKISECITFFYLWPEDFRSV